MDEKEQERKIAMEYRIISGAAEERRHVYMTPRSVGRIKRAGRRCKTPPAQVKRNENEAKLRLARILNCNYRPGDLFINAMYPKGKEPTFEQAVGDADKLKDELRKAYREKTGNNLKWVLVTSVTDPRTGEPAPVHHHLVVQQMDWEIIASLWDPAHMDYRPLDGSGDYTGIANYMVDNSAAEPGKKKWRTSRGMEKPVYTEPKPCASVGAFRIPKDARVRERKISDGESVSIKAAYIRFTQPGKMLRDVKTDSGAGAGGNNQAGRGHGNKENARGREGGLNTGGGDTRQVRKGEGRAEKADNQGKGGPGGGTAGSDHGKGKGKNRNADADNGRGSGNNRKADADNNTSGGRGGHAV